MIARLDLDGVACQLVDAAGDGPAADAIGRLTQNAAAAQRRTADIRLRCVDASSRNGGASILSLAADELLVLTKIDLQITPQASEVFDVTCSSVTGAGIDELAQRLRPRILELKGEPAGAAATAARCVGSLQRAEKSLAAAGELAAAGAGDELVAAEIRAALADIGDVVGAVCADDVLDRVFSQFCIGK